MSSSPSPVASAAPTIISSPSIAPSVHTRNSTSISADTTVAQSIVLLIAVMVFLFLLMSFLTVTIFYCRKLMRLDEYGEAAAMILELELAAAAPTETVAYVRATSTDNLASAAVISNTTTSSNHTDSRSSNSSIFFNSSRGFFGWSSSKVAATSDATQLPVAAEYHEIYNREPTGIGDHNSYVTPVRVIPSATVVDRA